MGLLDDLLGGPPQPGQARPPSPAPGGGMSHVLTALLPVVLSMLASRQGGRALGAGPGALGAEGGLGELLEQFRRTGHGRQADSWVGTGANLPLPPEVLAQVFGHDELSRIARQAGVTEEEASAGLSEILPDVVDRVTPQGRVPDADALAASVDALVRRMGR